MAAQRFKTKKTSSASTQSSTDKLQNQIKNYETRLKNVGIDPKEATDTRNVVEKALNLEKDQNVLFDIFEILDRPRNALFTGVNEALSGGDFLSGLGEGITGETKTSGKDILVDRLGLPDTEGQLDLADVLGFGLDIAGDPMDWALFGGKSASDAVMNLAKKGVKKGANLLDKGVTKGLQVLDKAELNKIGKLADQAGMTKDAFLASQGLSLADFGKRASGYADAKRGFQDAFAQGKTAVGKLKASARGAQDSEALIEQLSKGTIDNLEDLSYNYVLNTSKNVGKYADDLTSLNSFLQTKGNTVQKWVKENADSGLAKALTKEQKVVAENITNVIQSTKDTTIRGKNAIKQLIETGEFSGNEESVDAIKKLLEQTSEASNIPIELTTEATKDSKKAAIEALQDSIASGNLSPEDLRKAQNELTALERQNAVLKVKNKDVLKQFDKNANFKKAVDNLDLKYNLEYNADELALIDELTKNPEFMNLVESHKQGYKQIAKNIKDVTGVDYGDIVNRQGYLRKAKGTASDIDTQIANLTSKLSDPNIGEAEKETIRNSIESLKQKNLKRYGFSTGDSFSSQEYRQPAVVANRQYQAEKAREIEQVGKQIESLKGKYSNTQRTTLQNTLTELEGLKSDSVKMKKLNEKLSKVNITVDNLSSKINDTNSNLKKITDRVTDDILDKATKIQDQSVTKSLVKNTSDIDDLNKQLNSLTKKLADVDNLDEKTVKNITNKIDKLNKQLEEKGNSLRKVTDIIDGHVDNTTMKALDNSAKNMQKYADETLKLDKLRSAREQATFKQTQLTESLTALNSSIEGAINNTNFKLGSIDEAADAAIDKQIKSLEKTKSILESQAGETLFDLNFYAGLEDFVKNAEFTNREAIVFRDALAMGVFNDTNVVRTIENVGDKVPNGWVRVSGKNVADRLNDVQTLISEGKISPELRGVIENLRGNTYYMDRRVASLIGVATKDTKEVNAILNLTDKLNNLFKKYSVLTPGFQVRNYTGNTLNMYLSGMPVGQIPKYQARATKVLNSMNGIIDKVSKGTKLTAEESATWDLIKQFTNAGFNQAGTAVQDLQKVQQGLKLGGNKNIVNKVSDINIKMNNNIDAMNRMALLMYANDDIAKGGKYLKRLNAKDPVQAVKYALMDPSNMSEFEQNVVKKIIPFYTFTKQNLMFQATNIFKNTRKYKNVIKALNATYEDLPEDSYYQYQKESMQIPIPGATDDDGNQLFLKANLPLSDLGEFISNPLQRTVASSTPLIKAPVEAVTGKNLFTGQDTKYNTISTNLAKLGINNTGVSSVTDGAELILNNFGLQNVSTNIIKKVAAILETSSGDKSSSKLWSEIFRSILQNTKQENVINSGLYDQMEQYQAIIKQLKNQGMDVPTIQEMTASNSIKLNRMKRKRALTK